MERPTLNDRNDVNDLDKKRRKRIAVPTSLRQGNALLGAFTSRDLGADGITLRGSLPNLAHNSVVTVSVALQQLNTIVTESFKAVVTGQHDGCIGLMWMDQRPDLYELLPHEDCLAA